MSVPTIPTAISNLKGWKNFPRFSGNRGAYGKGQTDRAKRLITMRLPYWIRKIGSDNYFIGKTLV
jgi:hypothetical protein